MPFFESRNATEKIPAAPPSPEWIGVSATLHVRPLSVDLKTRATEPPPVAIQAFDEPWTVRQVPLAANDPSFGIVEGSASGETRDQLFPPSSVRSRKGFPSTGSLITMPWSRSQNESASKKTPF